MARKPWKRWVLLAVVGAGVGGYVWIHQGLEPLKPGPSGFVRWNTPSRLGSIVAQLKVKGIIRNGDALRLYAFYKRVPSNVTSGTYEFHPGMTADEVLSELQKPIRQMVRIPETNWAQRTANLLEKKGVVVASEYMALVKKPAEFKSSVSFPLPADSLEGYLYPDTYDFPPLLGAHGVIERQLQAFDKKIWKGLGEPKDLDRLITEASLVELESGRDEDRPKIAGVIENRLQQKMRLQIDASLLYGIQKWRRLTFADYKNIDSPYNLYKVDGLPPGPICSPSLKSIEAALKPAKHDSVFYVALPTGETLFSKTYADHLKNIEKRKKAIADLQKP
ncbi:endolytic transglycosylase MltG [soil metagenome]